MDKPLRLLVIGVAWPIETFLDRLLRGLAEQGILITLAMSQRPSSSWLQTTRAQWLPIPTWQGLNVGAWWHLSAKIVRNIITAQADVRTLWSYIDQSQAWSSRLRYRSMLSPFAGRRWDVIYFPWNSHAITYLPLFDLGMPVVLSCRGAQVNIAPYNPRRGEIREGLRATFDHAALVHCVSQDILQEAQVWGLDPTIARVIHPAVDPDVFVPPPQQRLPDKIFRVVTTGSLIWRKGLEYALLAVRQLVDAGVPVQFEIIGEGSEHDRVLFTIHDLELQRHVRLFGRLEPAEVLNRLQHADVFLLTSLSEGISNAALEAMACSLPIVTSDCGGMREAVTDGVEGFVTPMRDPAAMAFALQQLWGSLDLCLRMGQAGREKVLRNFSIQDQVDQFARFFRETADQLSEAGSVRDRRNP